MSWRNRSNPRRRSLAHDRRGVVAIEFALSLPLTFGLFLATVEVTTLARARMKFSAVADSMASLVSEQNPIGQGTMIADFCTGEGYAMAPFSAATLKVRVDSVTNTNGTLADAWTKSCGTISNPRNPVTLAAALVPNPGNSVIVVQTQYTYSAAITYLLPATATFTGTGFAQPRLGTPIAYPP
jgi:Flp pilus assembly protein TadG